MGVECGKNVSVRASDGTTVVAACRLADTVLARARGLLGRRVLELAEGESERRGPSIGARLSLVGGDGVVH